MQRSVVLRTALTALFLAAATGCTTWTNGRPVAIPPDATEPAFPTPRPSRTPPNPPSSSTEVPAPSATAAEPPGGETLDPNQQGYVYIETKSGKTRCKISRSAVGCEAEFTNPPIEGGIPATGVSVTADGKMRWLVGNLGAISPVTLDYRTYRAQGWTIAADQSGTRFVNGDTGHGMFVSIERVEAF